MQRDTYIRGNNNKKKIKEPDFPAEAPESNADECETYNTQQSMYDLSGDSAKELIFVEKDESDDRCNNNRATDEQYPGNRRRC